MFSGIVIPGSDRESPLLCICHPREGEDLVTLSCSPCVGFFFVYSEKSDKRIKSADEMLLHLLEII